jgi:hypothetical protein
LSFATGEEEEEEFNWNEEKCVDCLFSTPK